MMNYTLKNGKQLRLRKAEVADAEALLDYLRTVGGETDYLTFGEEGVGLSLEEERKFLESKSADDNHFFMLAIVDDQVVGTIGLVTPKRARVIHNGEFGMSVMKDYWNCGIGGFMIDHMIEWARSRRIIRKINLSVRTDNLRAINLYLRKGFSVEGCHKAFMKVGGRYFDVYHMGCWLEENVAG